MIIVTIRTKTRADKRTEFTQTVTSLLDQISKSSGYLDCHFYQEFGDENTFCLAEEWASQEDFENHLRSNVFCVLLGAMRILLEQPSDIKISDVTRTADHKTIDDVLENEIQSTKHNTQDYFWIL